MQIQLTVRAPTPRNTVAVPPTRVQIAARPLRVLDFDIENRPLSYLGSDFTTAEVTSIAWAWVDRPQDITVYLLGETPLRDILERFVAVYDQADWITGHYLKGHDLPMINGALMEFQMPGLTDKRTQDTKCDLMRAKGLSKSQESLAAMFGLSRDKVHMNQHRWRQANRLTPEGLAYVRERVIGDVTQHMELRAMLWRLGYLSPPSIWYSKSETPLPTYTV